MNRLTLSLSVLLIMGQFAVAQKTKSPFQHDNFFGRVKLVVETDYQDRKKQTGKMKTDTFNRNISKYDDKGNIAERVNYKAIGGSSLLFNSRYIYITKYNDKGYKTEVELYKNFKEGILKYNDKGELKSFEGYLAGGNKLWFKHGYQYDEKDNQVVENDYNDKDSLLTVRKFKYDNAGNAVTEYNFYTNSKFNSEISYSYSDFDEKGNWTKRKNSLKLKDGTLSMPIVTRRQISYY